MERLLLTHASELVTASGRRALRGGEMREIGVIPDGAVLIEDGLIAAVGPTERIAPLAGQCETLDCSGRTVLPGFVDSHTHFIFAGHRAEEFSWRLRGESYMSIMERGGGIGATVGPTRAASEEELEREGAKRLASMLRFGVTTAEGKSGYGLDLDTELRQLAVMERLSGSQPVEVVSTFLGAHAVPEEYKGRTDEYVEFMIRQVLPQVKEQGIARFCDVFCEKNVFSVEQSRRLLTAAREMGFALKLHADEMVTLGGASLAAELGAVSADHLLHADERGIRDLAQSGTVATLLPATAFCLREPYADARRMIDSGCAVAVASDYNPGSCYTNSVPLLFALCCLYMHMSVEETITALTLNGAAALGLADRIGSIEPGKQADIAVLDCPSRHYLPYHTGVNLVERVIKKGKIVL